MTILTLLLSVAAMALFGLSTTAHHQRRLGGHLLPAQRRRLRAGAWAAVTAAFPAALAARGAVFGPMLWIGALMLGAAAVFLLLNLLPGRAARGRGGPGR